MHGNRIFYQNIINFKMFCKNTNFQIKIVKISFSMDKNYKNMEVNHSATVSNHMYNHKYNYEKILKIYIYLYNKLLVMWILKNEHACDSLLISLNQLKTTNTANWSLHYFCFVKSILKV